MSKDRTQSPSTIHQPDTDFDEALRRVITAGSAQPSQSAFRAAPDGDILKIARSLHPKCRIDQISDAETAVAESEALLAEAARDHHRNLTRLAVLRENAGLATKPPTRIETMTRVVAGTNVLVGRVTARQELTRLTKTNGLIALDCGETVPWIASASYVDMLEPLFNGLPIVATGSFHEGSLRIQEVRPAPVEYWTGAEAAAYDWFARLGQSTVTKVTNLKKSLLAAAQHRCRECQYGFPNVTQAAVADHGDGTYTVLCRPCKETWKAAGRPAAEAVAS